MLRWFFCIVAFFAIQDGYSASSTPAPESSKSNSTNYAHNNVSIIVALSSPTDNKSGANWSQLSDFLKEHSIPFNLATLSGDRTDGVDVEAHLRKTEMVNVTITDVTSDLVLVNASEEADVASFVNSSLWQSDGSSRFILIDPCAAVQKRKNETLRDLFDLSGISDNFYGFYIDLKKKPHTNATSPTFTSDLVARMDLNRSYFVSVSNASIMDVSTFVNMTSKLCWRLGISRGRRNGTTVAPTAVTDLPCLNSSENATEECQNANVTENVTANATGGYENETSTEPATTASPNTGRANVSADSATGAKAQPTISAGHSNASLAIGILVALAIIVVAGIVFRRKITNFVSKRMRSKESDNQMTAVRYGTLKDGDEFDLDVLPRRPNIGNVETRW